MVEIVQPFQLNSDEYVSSISKQGDVQLHGDVTLTGTGGTSLTQTGQNIQISSTATSPGGSNTQIQFNNSGAFGGSSGLTWDGITLKASSITDSGLTSGRIPYATTAGLLTDSAKFLFDGSDASLYNPTNATSGTTSTTSPYLIFRASQWNVSGGVANEKKVRLSLSGSPTPDISATTSAKLQFELYNTATSLWKPILAVRNDPAYYLRTELVIASPTYPDYYGGIISVDYDSAFIFKTLTGAVASVRFSVLGGTAYAAANQNITLSGNGLKYYSYTAGGGTYPHYAAHYFDTDTTISNADYRLVSWYNHGTEKAFFSKDGYLGIGVGANNVSAAAHIILTTEQLRLGYNASNYFSTTVGSTGSTTFALTGTSPIFTFSQGVTFSAGITLSTQNIVTDGTTGTKIGTATSQKLGFWNTAPIVQPTTAITAASFVANTSGIVDDSATFDGYTIGQVVKALRNAGLLA